MKKRVSSYDKNYFQSVQNFPKFSKGICRRIFLSARDKIRRSIRLAARLKEIPK